MRFDLTDALLILCVLVIIAGVAMVYVPAALIVGGCLVAALALLTAGRARR